MKLNTEQIEYVSNYIKSFDIKWYELQVELTDHMITSMEEIWEKEPELTFHQVKQYAENRFGRDGFNNIVKERKVILQKEYNRSQRKMIAQYLKFPKIISSLLLMFLAYQVSFYFVKPHKYLGVLFALLFLFIVPMFYQRIKNKKINGKRFLAVDYSHAYVGLMIFPQMGINLSNMFKEEIQENHLLVLPFCLLWVLGVLFFITGIHLKKKIVENIKKQYQLT
jgi:hypothetical protein